MVPATPVESSGMFTEGSLRSKISFVATPIVEMEECSASYNSVVGSSDANDDEEDDDSKASGLMTETSEVAVVSAGRSEVRPGFHYDTREESSESDDDYLGPKYHDGELTREWAQEVRDLSAVDNHSTPPRLRIATHLPLNSIEPFCGTRNQSEMSMQWLRTFVYGMKGTHKPPNAWCVAFELSLYDGAQHWYRQLPRKTKRTWTLLSQAFIKYYCAESTRSAMARYYSAKRFGKDHGCDYLNRLNGYARNAGVQFEGDGRDAKHHVEHFLDTCNDRGLEECLCHVRVSDIYELEGMIEDILRYRERNSAREPSLRRYRSQDDDRRREGRSTEGPRKGYHRERGFRDSDRYHDRSRVTPLVEALLAVFAALKARGSDGARTSSLDVRQHGYDTTDGCGNDERAYKCSQHSDEKSGDGYGSGPTHGRIESTTENEHRVVTNGVLDVIRGMDRMNSAAVSLDLLHDTARLPNEVVVPLWKCQGNSDNEPHDTQVVGGPTEDLYIPGREWREFRLPRQQPPLSTHAFWIRRSEALVPTLTKFRRGRPTWVRLTNVASKETRCSTHVPVVLWIPKGELPHKPGYARLDSGKYRDWQVLAYANSRNKTLFGREQQLYERWLAEQTSAVDHQDYSTPRIILTRATEALRSADECRITSIELTGLAPAVTDDLAGPGVPKPSVIVQEGALGRGDGQLTSSEALNVDGPTAVTRGSDDGGIIPIDGSAKIFKPTQGFKTSGAVVVDRSRDGDKEYGPSEVWNDHGAELARPDTSDYSDDGATDGKERLLDAGYASAVDAMPPEDPSCNEADATDTFKYRPNEAKPIENLENVTKLTGYGDKSAFIPDSSEAMLTYSEPIGQSRGMDAIQREILITNVPTPPVCNPRVMGQVTTTGSHRSWALWILLLWTVVIAASAYLEDKAVTLVGYTGTRNGVYAALEPQTEALTVARDSRFAIQQSLGAIPCLWKSFMTQPNRHQDLTTKLRSVAFLHGERDFNVAADSLVSEARENEVSMVVSSDTRLSELSGLNRTRNVTPAGGLTSSEPSVNVAQASVAYLSPGDRNFFGLVRGRAERDYDGDDSDFVKVVTGRQTRAREKLVRFADEVSVMGPGDATRREDSYEVPTEALGGIKLHRSSFEVKACDSCNMAPTTIVNEPSVGTSSDERAACNALDARPRPLLRRMIRVWPYTERDKPDGAAKLARR